MAIHYDDSTIWDYTLQDVTAIILTIFPYIILLLMIAINFFLMYKEKISEILNKIYDYKNKKNIYDSLSELKSSQQKLLETIKNEDLKIQEMIGRTNEKLHDFSQRLDGFQDLCLTKYGEIISTLNHFSNKNVVNKLEQMGYKYQEHVDVEDFITEDFVQDPMTKDADQDVIRVDSEITGPDENRLKRNLNQFSKIPLFKKM